MPMPRRLDYIIKDTVADERPFVIVRNDLTHSKAIPADELPSFQSLSSALQAIELDGGQDDGADAAMTAAVSKHPRFPEAMQQFNSFMSVMLPSCAPITEHTFRENNASGRGSTPERTTDPGDSMSPLLEDAAGPYEANVELHEASRVKKLRVMSAVHRTQGDPPKANLSALCLHSLTSVTQAFETLISYLKRRRERAEQFYATITEFVQEYNSLQQDLSLAEPLLKGTHLEHKRQQMAMRMQEQYGNQVRELQQRCVNKRRRANLPKESVQVMEDWFSAHRDNPYPSDEEKRALAATANLREEQVSNWFVNVRKRYWRPAAAK